VALWTLHALVILRVPPGGFGGRSAFRVDGDGKAQPHWLENIHSVHSTRGPGLRPSTLDSDEASPSPA